MSLSLSLLATYAPLTIRCHAELLSTQRRQSQFLQVGAQQQLPQGAPLAALLRRAFVLL